MQTEILILDSACSKAYTDESLVKDSLGGTESTTIRVAEGLAKHGHKVIIVEKHELQAYESPNGVTYAPWSWGGAVDPKIVIHLRSVNYVHNFPKAKQFIWMHDAADPEMNRVHDWLGRSKGYDVKFIAVSDWHVKNLEQFCPGMNASRIYSPVDETFLNYPRPKSYDKNQLVWMSSPHKGLDGALESFKKLLKINPEFKLVVFNPGYFEQAQEPVPRVAYLSKCSRANMKSIISQSLCVFFPTMYEETLGMFAMEANALGTPVACYKNAALAESVNNEFAKDEEALLNQVLSWHKNGRPEVNVCSQFLFENIYPEWKKLLS